MGQETSRIGSCGVAWAAGGGKRHPVQADHGALRDSAGLDGDLLRENVTRGTELGKAAKAVMARGELVSDELVCDHGAGAVAAARCQARIYPGWFSADCGPGGVVGCAAGAESLINRARTRAWPIVIRLDVDYNQLLQRITGRRSCPTCGRIYNVHFQPPRVDELCDLSHGDKAGDPQ